MDANTLAKAANGLCDNLLTCILRAWDHNSNLKYPIIICPAMNTAMWEHPITVKHLDQVKEFGYFIVPPIRKILICGDEGMGAMASIPDIMKTIDTVSNQKLGH